MVRIATSSRRSKAIGAESGEKAGLTLRPAAAVSDSRSRSGTMGSESLTDPTPLADGVLHAWHDDSPKRPNGKSRALHLGSARRDFSVLDDMAGGAAETAVFRAPSNCLRTTNLPN